MIADDCIEECVEVIKKINHLNRLTVGRNGREANNVTKVNSDTVKILWFHSASQFEHFSHWSGEEEQKINSI